MAPSSTRPVICREDFQVLKLSSALARRAGDPCADVLLRKLMDAIVCSADELPEDAVALDTRVLYRLGEDTGVRATLLVHPRNVLFPQTETSAMSPLGIALLGLRPGERTAFADGPETAFREVMVEGVGWRLRFRPSTTRRGTPVASSPKPN